MIRTVEVVLFAMLVCVSRLPLGHSLQEIARPSKAATSEAKPAKEDKDKPSINLNAPAAPPESVEARMALRQHRPVSALNRYTFAGNVLEGIGDHVDHWIVMFCPSWHEKCQGLMPSYELLGVQWENKQNKDSVMSSKVRFAKVDCATDKALCVSLDIDDYPAVVHYHNNQRVNSWHGGAPGLVRFVKQELEGPKKRKANPVPKKTIPTCSFDEAPDMEKELSEGSSDRLAWLLRLFRFTSSPGRSICFALILLLAVRGAWDVASSTLLRRRQCVPKPEAAAHVPTERTAVCTYVPVEWARERQPIEL